MGATSKSLSENPRGNIAGESESAFPHGTSAPNNAGTYAGLNGNHFEAHKGNNFSARARKDLPAFSITQLELTERVQRVMREFAGNENAVAKVSMALQCSTGTAKNYLEGRTTPQGIHDARAMAAIPGYFSMKAELAGLQMALDPRHQAKLVAFMRFCQTEADSIFGGAP